MKKSKTASQLPAVTQPKSATTATRQRRQELAIVTARCNPPLDPEKCIHVAEWRGQDGTWEQLLYDRHTNTFYLDWSFCEPADVTISEALHWYGCKRKLECEYGSLSWWNIELLISEAVRELQLLEERMGKKSAAA